MMRHCTIFILAMSFVVISSTEDFDMPSGGSDLRAAFGKFASEAYGTEATSKDITRWFTDAGGVLGRHLSRNYLDIAFSKTMSRTTITADQMFPLIGELAKAYMKDKNVDEDTARAQIFTKLAAAEPKAHGTAVDDQNA